ncbi:hypothetical protein EBR21_16150, partial [bacterium]|nr:hypothetical protein [bacterium]
MRSFRFAQLKSVPGFDSRILMMTVMASLLGAGVFAFDFSLHWTQIALTFVAGLGCQYAWMKTRGLKTHSMLSACITCFGTVSYTHL